MKNIKRFYKVNERNRFSSPCRFAATVALLLISIVGFSQNPVMKVFEDWNDTAGTQNTFQQSVVRSKGTGGVVYHYVAGATLNGSGNYDMMVSKYTAGGALVWTQTYNGAGNGDDMVADMQITSGGDVFITGSYYENSTDSNNAITIMYKYDGTLQWASTYNGNGSGNDGTVALYYDYNASEIYCVGSEWEGSTNMYDMLVLKYDISGNQLWVTTFDDANWEDLAYRVSCDRYATHLYVAGSSMPYAGKYDYTVLNIKPADGSINTSYTTSLSPLGIDKITDLQIDGNGNAYVTGGAFNGTSYDYLTARLDTALIPVWTAQWDDPSGLNDIATSLSLDLQGNVFVTGSAETTSNGIDYATVKYDSTGTQIWVSTFNGTNNGNDSATGIVVKDTNQIYVTGRSFNGATDDYSTIKYDMSGNQVWEIGFNSLQNGDDAASAIALDTLGGIVVTGQNKLGTSIFAYTTVKYLEKKTLLPQDTVTSTSSSFIYMENRGQLLNTSGDSVPQIRYYVIKGGPQVFFTDTSVSYVFAKLDTSSTPSNDTIQRVDMKFVGANSDLRIRAMDVRSDYENFFLGHIPEGRSRVQNFDKLVSYNVWNKVDMIYGSNMKGMKYYFICKPLTGGSSYASIDLKYEGADSVKIDGSGQLIIYTKLGNIVQPKAAAWQIDANGNYSSLGWQPSYNIVATNEVKFTSLGSYNSSLPLIFAVDWGYESAQNIQNITWSTFVGGGSLDQFHDIQVIQNSGEIVLCGNTLSTSFPGTVSSNIYSSNQGGKDAVVITFDNTGNLFWATYYGGGAEDYANGIDVDGTGNVYITGVTKSSNFPSQSWGSAYTQAWGGSFDQFVVALSSSGQNKIWSTYYGGSGIDKGTDISISPTNGDIIMVGNGASGFPTYNPPAWSTGTGTIVRFNSLGVRQWATKIGSSGGGGVEGITIDQSGDFVVAGYVPSGTGFQILNNGGNGTYGGGTYDGFVTKITGGSTNNIDWSTYFGGTGSDQILDIASTPSGSSINYYITGRSDSPSLPSANPSGGAYVVSSLASTGYDDAIVAQFNLTGTLIWSTFFGGTLSEEGYAITLDGSENVFIAGITNGTDLPVPSTNLVNGYDNTTLDGPQDAFVACFIRNSHAHVWTTYLGGSDYDYGYTIGCYGSSDLYLAGLTSCRSDFPLDNGAGIPFYDGTVVGGKAFITRFDLTPVVVASIGEPSTYSGLLIYPNPTQGVVNISGQNPFSNDDVIRVYNAFGQIIYQSKIFACPILKYQIDLSPFASGIYLIEIEIDGIQYTQKILLDK